MTMTARPLRLPDVIEITPQRHEDERGYFLETFREGWFRSRVAPVRFLQENQSLSVARGTLRGLHFQHAPEAQGKLVRCIQGAIFDVAVDIRPESPTFGDWVSIELTADQGNQLWIPPGFAHGFCALTPNALICYKVTACYSSSHDAAIAWDDPDIGVDWPDFARPDLLSAKDRAAPRLNTLRAA